MKIEELMFVEYKFINKKEIEMKVSIDYDYMQKKMYDNHKFFWIDCDNIIHFQIKEYHNVFHQLINKSINTYKVVLITRKKNWLFENIIYTYYDLNNDNILKIDIEYPEKDLKEMMVLCRIDNRRKYGNKDLKYFTFTEKIKISDIKKQLKVK